jgi:hypothetical protein
MADSVDYSPKPRKPLKNRHFLSFFLSFPKLKRSKKGSKIQKIQKKLAKGTKIGTKE